MQIALNMERWRWLPRKEPASRVEVNIAAAMLNAFVDDKSVLEMLAIAGKPMRDDMTPMLISKITSITFNPPWIVPKDIARRELFPKERHDHHYFAREGFRVRRGHLVQEPGPKNALGRIKFDFDNAFSVYLHDTPDKGAFFLKRRSVSHGCVRLQQPVELAKLLLTGSPRWTPEKIDQALSNTDTIKADLRTPMTVMLLYWTAYPEGDGVAFRKDVYHWDSKLAELLDHRPI
jgi:murein L,D-transpeptidase YcbB/YkuD